MDNGTLDDFAGAYAINHGGGGLLLIIVGTILWLNCCSGDGGDKPGSKGHETAHAPKHKRPPAHYVFHPSP